MYEIVYSTQFKKDYKKAVKQNLDISLLKDVIQQLSRGEALLTQHKDHPLLGDYKGCRECHIKPNWLLIYKVNEQQLELLLIRTGTHSELFKK